MASREQPPLSPREAWLSDGRHVLHFRPTRWDRWAQELGVVTGELLPGEPVPLLKRRLEMSREEALRLWAEKHRQSWQVCPPQWTPPPEGKPPGRCPATTMGAPSAPPCF